VSEVRVLESVVTERCGRGASVGDQRTCKAQVVELFFVRHWTIGDAVNQGTEHWTATSFVDAEDVWSRCCGCWRVIGV